MSGAKIVGIHGGNVMANNVEAGHAGARPLPLPLVKLREFMKLKTKGLLRKLFESADDSLFAMADKAGTNGDQTMYFDAMRELRLQRKEIATEVIKGLIQSFNELGDYRSVDSKGTRKEDDLDELSLIQNDDLELKVAIDGMVNRVRNVAGPALNDLHARAEFLVSPVELSAEQTPASPEVLCDCFATGCTALDVEIKARLVVFKLFEKYVLAELGAVYTEANQLLIQAGVMPDLKKQRAQQSRNQNPRNQNPGGPASSATNRGASPFDDIPVLQPIDPEVCKAQFEDLRHLMHPDMVLSTDRAHQHTASDASFYTQGELVSALSVYQKQHLKHLDEQLACNVIDFRKLLSKRLESSKDSADYSELDSDVINLVAMLFEFILDDRQLQPTMKALISRLQIPILKVAIMDRTFFNRGGHPARKLLNEIAAAAIGWNEKKDGKPDRLKEKIEAIVQTILSDFDQDLALFANMLEDFTSFTDLEQRRGQLVEQRTKDSERGKAANDLARQAVREVLDERMKDKSLPECVTELLQDGWSCLMVLQYLKEGDSGESWMQSIELVNDLIWTVCPPESCDTKQKSEIGTKLLRMIPGVIRRLREGLQEASFDEFRTSALLQDLEDAQVTAIQNIHHKQTDTAPEALAELPPAASESAQSESRMQAADPAELHDDVVADLIRETQEMEAEFSQHQVGVASKEGSSDIGTSDETIDHSNAASQKQEELTEEIVLSALDKPITDAVIDESDPFVQQVDKLSTGCWFEFQNEGRPERCKLAAVIKATGKYIFVNRSGVKVAEKTRMGLAVELRRGSVQILNDGLLFDRALESVIGNLRGRNEKI